jgi:predicted polyphosphate/ATP-dependent NAD kinase
MAAQGVDLLLFAGGDGTARDVCGAIGTSLTALGIPAGVKIQSAVFATSPAAAGQVAQSYLTGGIGREKEAEVVDIDEDAYRRDILSARLCGYLKIPDARRLLQGAKAASAPDERAMQRAIAAELVEQITDDRCYIVGPGTTCRPLMEMLGLEDSLLGVDMIRARRLVGKDVSEREILENTVEGMCSLILTPVGGQGFLLGRGNQQISPAVIRKVGKGNIIVAATAEKLSSLRGRPLLVDTGDAETDSYLCGYYRVVTGYRENTIYRVSDCA